jgi:hypothetical protein
VVLFERFAFFFFPFGMLAQALDLLVARCQEFAQVPKRILARPEIVYRPDRVFGQRFLFFDAGFYQGTIPGGVPFFFFIILAIFLSLALDILGFGFIAIGALPKTSDNAFFGWLTTHRLF